MNRLKDIQRRADIKKEKEREKNNLEAYIYETREKITSSEEVAAVTTEEQRESFVAELNTAEEWLYDEGFDSIASEYRSKLRALKEKGDKIFLRVSEAATRPQAITLLEYTLNVSIEYALNISQTLNITEEELIEFMELCDDTQKWLASSVAEQDALQPHQEPALTTEQITRKMKLLETQLRILSRKPKKKPPKKVTDDSANSTIETQDTAADDSASQQPDEQQKAAEEQPQQVDEEQQQEPQQQEQQETQQQEAEVPETSTTESQSTDSKPTEKKPKQIDQHKHDEL